jgi:putative ABC transport system ATP-binding protein
MIAPGAVLEMRRVTKEYPSPAGAVSVLRNVDLRVAPGEFVMVTGPSGSGKTTLLNIASLLDQPTSGDVLFKGESVSGVEDDRLCEARKLGIGMVFQRFHLLPNRSAIENVAFRFRYVGCDEGRTRRASEEALAGVGLMPQADRPARLLSAGEMQRVAIARAVALRPDLLVADEPTGNLDREATEDVMACFADLNRAGLTILMVTHNEALLPHASRHLTCRNGVLE